MLCSTLKQTQVILIGCSFKRKLHDLNQLFGMRFDLDILQKCWFLAGPTACGKSEVGVELAGLLDGEIVSLDSMSLYRRMDIGTAKPSSELRRRVAHHLIDVIEPHDEYSVAEYVTAAELVCRAILERGSVPLFVGGTGLYLRSILRGVFHGPPANWELRRQLEQEAAQHGPAFLHELLSDVDPDAAESLHPNDTRRLIRALEVHRTTGQTLSEQQQHSPLPPDQRPQHVFWLSPPRDWLYDRINCRVQSMISLGLVDEVRRLLSDDKPLSRTAQQALGYKEIIEHLEGNMNLDQAVEQIQTRTRQFAKRQHTWFRNLVECTAVEITGHEEPFELAERLLALQSTSQL